jgi:hypothetical protein
VVKGKALSLFLCLLLAALVVVQATQIAPHTCVDDLRLSDGDTADTVLDSAPEPEDFGLPICVACALASQCGAPHVDSAPAAAPPVIEGCVADDTPPEASADLAVALLPRPPPPTV